MASHHALYHKDSRRYVLLVVIVARCSYCSRYKKKGERKASWKQLRAPLNDTSIRLASGVQTPHVHDTIRYSPCSKISTSVRFWSGLREATVIFASSIRFQSFFFSFSFSSLAKVSSINCKRKENKSFSLAVCAEKGLVKDFYDLHKIEAFFYDYLKGLTTFVVLTMTQNKSQSRS